MYEVKLPNLSWFSYGNIFTGSLGTDSNRGCLCIPTMNYKVFISNSCKLTAACSYLPVWNDTKKIKLKIIDEFEVNDFVLGDIEKWILSNYIADYSNIAIDGLLLEHRLCYNENKKGRCIL